MLSLVSFWKSFWLNESFARLILAYSGALGLNGGIADVGSLRDCLVAIHEDKANDTILDTYSEVRRDKWKTIIDPMSQGTLKMIFSDPANIADQPAYKMSQLMKTDPEAARARAPVSIFKAQNDYQDANVLRIPWRFDTTFQAILLDSVSDMPYGWQ